MLSASYLVEERLRHLDMARHSDSSVTLSNLIEQSPRFLAITAGSAID